MTTIFANGGVFPKDFSYGFMGESCEGSIMPLANVGGRLGVAAIAPQSNDELTAKILAELKVLREGLKVIISNECDVRTQANRTEHLE